MSVRISTIAQEELERFLDASNSVLCRCLVQTDRGLGLLATPEDGKYPFVYTRPLAVAIVALVELGDGETARSLARFLLGSQSRHGAWVERYDRNGVEAHDQWQPDVTALAIWALLTYVRASGDQAFGEEAREPIEEATRYISERALNPYIYLIESANASPDSNPGEGFDLWCNCAHAAAFALCHRVYGGERYRRLGLLIRRSIGLLMTSENRFVRRLDCNGYPDPRPDMGLISPHYFGLWAPTERAVVNSAEAVERTLWNVEIGGFVRQLPFSRVDRLCPPGPMPHVSAWMARYHYDAGNKDRAEAIVRWLFDASTDGDLPEVRVPRTSAVRYLDDCRQSIEGLSSALPPGSGGSPAHLGLLRERLLSDLDQAGAAAERQEIADSGRPFVWAHLETLRALKRGGHIERWALNPESAGRT